MMHKHPRANSPARLAPRSARQSAAPIAVAHRAAEFAAGTARLRAELAWPVTGGVPKAWVLVPRLPAPHRSRQPQFSTPGQPLLHSLHRAGLATFTVDLLTPEEAPDPASGFNTACLASRLVAATRWLAAHLRDHELRVAYLATGPAAAAALWAAAELRTQVRAVVSLGGRVDLASRRQAEVTAPVLLVVNRHDRLMLSANREADGRLNAASRLVIAPSFRYLRYWLREPGALDATLATEWMQRHLLGLAPAGVGTRPWLTDLLPSAKLRGQAAAAATVLALLASLAGPADPALAANPTVAVDGASLTYSADTGQTNQVTVQFVGSVSLVSGLYSIYNVSDVYALTAVDNSGAGDDIYCTGNGTTTLTCQVPIFASVNVNAGDLGDVVNLRSAFGPVSVNAGLGDDTVNVSSDAPTNDGALSLAFDVTLNGGGGNDQAHLSDAAASEAKSVTVNLGSQVIAVGSIDFTLNSTFTAGISLETGSNYADSIFIYSTRSSEPFTLWARSADVVHVGPTGSVQSILGPVTLENQPSYSDIYIGNGVDSTGRTVTFTAGDSIDRYGVISGLAPATIAYDRYDTDFVSLTGGSGSDAYTISGSGSFERYLAAGGGNDAIYMANAADTNGGTLDGGTGTDRIDYTAWASGVIVDLTTDFATGVNSSLIGSVVNIENATGGSGSDRLTGDSGANALVGNNGNDTLYGGDGYDNLSGGSGTDMLGTSGDYDYYINNTSLRREGVGSSTIWHDNDTISDIERIEITAGGSGNYIEAWNYSTGGLYIEAGTGNDYIIGGTGNDTIWGEAGNDFVIGSGGNDNLVGGADFDRLWETGNSNYVLTSGSLVGDGTDTFSFFEEIELNGTGGNDRFDISGYDDRPVTVYAYGGNDVVLLHPTDNTSDPSDYIFGHEGTDRIEVSGLTIPVLDNSALHNLVADYLNSIEQAVITGTANVDAINASSFGGTVTLVGLAGADALIAGSGDDVLSGGDGDDSLYGNDGNDTTRYDAGSNNATLTDGNINIPGQGNDSLSSVEYVWVTGNTSPNRFDAGGYTGLVTLEGGGGTDTLVAGTGGGSLDGGSGTDDLLEASGQSNFSLSNTSLQGGGYSFAITGIERASLVGTNSGDSLSAASFSGTVTLSGLDGNDQLTGGSNADSLEGGDGADTLTGNAGANTLDGGVGSDSLVGGANNDTLLGGAEPDVLVGGAGANSLDGGAGADTLTGGSGNDSLIGGTEDDRLTGSTGNDSLDGGDGTADYLVESGISGALTLSSSSMSGPLGSDVINNIERVDLTAGGGNDTLDASGFNVSGGAITLRGGGGDDVLSGGGSADSILGEGGDDNLSGGDGDDILDGGPHVAGDSANILVESGNLTITTSVISGQGNDTFVNIERFGIQGGLGDNLFNAAAFDQSITLKGGGGNDTLIGGPMADSLAGEDGDDVLVGNGSADTIDGGLNTDRVEATFSGAITLTNSALTIGAVTDVLSDTESASLLGGANPDTFNISSFTGRATLEGAGDADIFNLGTGGGRVVGGDDPDQLRLSVDSNLTLSDSSLTVLGRTFTLSTTEQAELTGGASANLIDASNFSGSTTLSGGGGQDTLRGGSGADSLLGGDNDDILTGSNGADTLLGGSEDVADRWVESGEISVTLITMGNLPIDVVSGVEQAQLTGNDNANLFNLTGFTGTATLDGAGGNDYLAGGEEGDTVLGGEGNDTILGRGLDDNLDAGGGQDRLVASGDVNFTLADSELIGVGTDLLNNSFEEAELTGGSGSSFFDATAFTGRVTMSGGDGPDTLKGGTNDDSLDGGPGDDLLEGHVGADILLGRTGNDSMHGGAGNDHLNAFEGSDTLFGGDDSDTLIGNLGSDWMDGGAGDDRLSAAFDGPDTGVGGASNDTLTGGLGNDTLEGGPGHDRLYESLLNTASASLTLANSSLLGLGTDSLSGFDEALLTGSEAADLLNASAFTGTVTLDGGAESDTLIGGTASDSLIGGDGAADQLRASGDVSFSLTDSLLTGLGSDTLSLVEQAIITGGVSGNNIDAAGFSLGPVTLFGLDGNDTLIAGTQNDSLYGGSGDDTLTGNRGNDWLYGEGGALDVVAETATGSDGFTLANLNLSTTIQGTTYTDFLSQVERASLTGGQGASVLDAFASDIPVILDGQPGNDTLIGSRFGDTLTGGSDNDRITGGRGNDVLRPAEGLDTLVEQEDADFTLFSASLRATSGADTYTDSIFESAFEYARLTGGPSRNIIRANSFAGSVTLMGAGGDDWLEGGVLADSLSGGDGNDVVLGHAGNNTLEGGSGADSLVGGDQDDSVLAGPGDDTLRGQGGFDTLDGGSADSDLLIELTPAADFSFELSDATLIGYNATTRITDTVVSLERASLSGGLGDNTIDAADFSGTVTLDGGSGLRDGGNDWLVGGPLADSLSGGFGDDTLSGNGGNDTLVGGENTDWVVEVIDSGNATLTDSSLTGSQGSDELHSVERVSLAGGAGPNRLDASAYTLGPVSLSGGDGADSLIGTAFGDSLAGEAGNDLLVGGPGDDGLDGGPDTDTITAAGDTSFVLTPSSLAGTNTDSLNAVEAASLDGGAGDNSFDVQNWPFPATIAGGGGADTLVLGGTAGDDNFTLAATQVLRDTVTTEHREIESLTIEGSPGNDTFALSGLQVSLYRLTADATAVSAMTLKGGDGDDTFNLAPLSSLLLDVQGGPHSAGDTLNFDSGGIYVASGPGQLHPEGQQVVTHSGIEFLNLLDRLYRLFLAFLSR